MDFNVDMILSYVALYGINLIGSLIIFIIGKKLAFITRNIVAKMMDKAKVDSTLNKFISNALYGILLVVISLAALNNLGVNTTSFVAILGAAGLAVGLAFKDTVSNIGAGVLLIFFRPFKVGDFIN